MILKDYVLPWVRGFCPMNVLAFSVFLAYIAFSRKIATVTLKGERDVMNAKIRHCAIWSDGCERSARFYETIFGMRFFTSLGVAERDPSNRSRGQLSDGIIGLALNPRPPGYRSGLDHFGLQLQDLDKVTARINQNYPDTIFTKGLEGVAFAGMRITDPVGTHIDIAQEAGANLRGGYRDEGWEQPRHLHHVAIRAKKPAV